MASQASRTDQTARHEGAHVERGSKCCEAGEQVVVRRGGMIELTTGGGRSDVSQENAHTGSGHCEQQAQDLPRSSQATTRAHGQPATANQIEGQHSRDDVGALWQQWRDRSANRCHNHHGHPE
jgi:hypothetical protein